MDYNTLQKNLRSQIKKRDLQGEQFEVVEFKVVFREAFFLADLFEECIVTLDSYNLLT